MNARKTDPHRSRLLGYACVVGATILWSVIPVCVKFAVEAFDAYTITWMRFAGSSAILFSAAKLSGTLKPLRRSDLRLAVAGAAGIGWNYLCYLRGLEDTTASAGNLIVQFEVVALVILSRFWLKESIGRTKAAGMAVTMAGVVLVAWNGEDLSALVRSKYFFGNALIFGAAPLWAIYAVCQKLLVQRGVPVSSSLAYIFAIAAVLTLPAMLIGFDLRGPVTAQIVISLAVLIVVSTAGSYALMAKGLQLLEASTAGMITCLLPIFTIAAARVFLGEVLTGFVGLGAVLVVGGLLVIAGGEPRPSGARQAGG